MRSNGTDIRRDQTGSELGKGSCNLKTVCCKHIPSYLGAEIHKRVECGRGKAEKIGEWKYGRERSNSQIKGNDRL